LKNALQVDVSTKAEMAAAVGELENGDFLLLDPERFFLEINILSKGFTFRLQNKNQPTVTRKDCLEVFRIELRARASIRRGSLLTSILVHDLCALV
jgi:hypothetical protein